MICFHQCVREEPLHIPRPVLYIRRVFPTRERIPSPRCFAAHPFLSLLSNIIVTGPSFTSDTCIMAPKTPSCIRCAPSG